MVDPRTVKQVVDNLVREQEGGPSRFVPNSLAICTAEEIAQWVGVHHDPALFGPVYDQARIIVKRALEKAYKLGWEDSRDEHTLSW
jgi:hypothetical protein